MRKAFSFVIILGFIILKSSIAYSQALRSFTSESDQYLKELMQFFKEEKGSEGKKFVEEFSLVWNSGKITDEQKDVLYKISNKMLKKKMKAFPHFHNYLSSVMSFINTSQSGKSYLAWQNSLESLINLSSSSKFISFIDISNNLFNANILYKSSSTIWKSDNNNYAFEYDSLPKIIFHNLKLTCYTNNDSSVIFDTKGVYYPTEVKFNGTGGTINWQRAGFSPDTVYANLKKYELFFNLSKFTFDSVIFYNKIFFKKPLIGVVNEKILANVTQDKATYPQFDSYEKRYKIDKLFEGVDYAGGFSMHGCKFIGSGSAQENAFLTFKSKYIFAIIGSKSFIIKKDRINSQSASLSLYFDKDSIYHPDIMLKYSDKDKEVEILRDFKDSPFFDSYHNIDMYIESIKWKLNEPKIDLSNIKVLDTENDVLFESVSYFDITRMHKIQGLNEINPLSLIKKYSETTKSRKIHLGDLNTYLRSSLEQTKSMVINLSKMGFMSYNSENEMINLKEKLFFYNNAAARKTDYDVIQFNSLTRGKTNNATINLLNFDLKIIGVDQISLSDSQNVLIFPKNREVLVKKNRDFSFAGVVKAGLFRFYGKEFNFQYNNFKVDLINVDSLTMFVRSRKMDEKGNYPLIRVRSVIEGIKGELLIDSPDNKSSRKSLAEYPILISKKESYVYYDKPHIQGGVYKRSNFYFQIKPFTLDSLDNHNMDALAYNGTFVSAGIFPDFEENLKVQPDYSLGFVRSTPKEGYKLYGDKGDYYSTINLSNKGLRGDGTLKYLKSTTKSIEFFFYPDSTNTMAQSFEIAEQGGDIQYPPVKGENVYIHWMPYKNIMSIFSKSEPISMYDNSKLTGNLNLSPTLLSGTGIIDFEKAEIESGLFKFKQKEFDSDTCDFKLKTVGSNELAFKTTNFSAHIDFVKRFGEFRSNGGSSLVEFPVNQYMCRMDAFTWYMDKTELELTSKIKTVIKEGMSIQEIADIDLSGSEFISTHPSQDSLRFFSSRATYNLKENLIFAKDVQYIKVADAKIFPYKNQVKIFKYAEMQTLENSKILCNTATKYHTVYNATTNITARNKYTATGLYDYVSDLMDNQSIYFTNIFVDKATGAPQTIGEAEIADNSDFKLSPHFDFYGKIKLVASESRLTFNGYTRIKHTCDKIQSTWFKFTERISPNKVVIPISAEIKNITNAPLSNGFNLASDSVHLYSTIISKKIKPVDLDILNAKGFLLYDEDAKEYRITTKDKLQQPGSADNYISLNTDNCNVYGEGEFNFVKSLGNITFRTLGKATHFTTMDSTAMEMVIDLNFFFNDDCIKFIAEKLSTNSSLKPVDVNSDIYNKALVSLLDFETAQKLKTELSLYGALKNVHKKMQHTFIFPNVKLKWSNATKSFRSYGQIAIGNILKKQINKYVDGYIELLKKKRGVDVLNIYIATSDYDWYFFTYDHSSNYMRAISSNEEFNKFIDNTKSKNRETKGQKGEKPYVYSRCPITIKNAFIKHMLKEE
ncbi:MAG: hypothetical protein Q8880_01845 [Bacteroidota bacterium]|nr:hypothetical protein [Bacteroidota bacterium]